MKLIKVYSPFLLSLMAATLFSCQHNDKDNSGKKAAIPAENRRAQAYLDKAEKYDGLMLYSDAFEYYNKAKESYVMEADSNRAGYALTKMAGLQYLLSDYTGCENTAVEALKYLGDKSDKSYLSGAYNILGISYKKLLNFDQSIAYYNKASDLTDNPLSQCILKNNIASIYIEEKHYEAALPILLKLNKTPVVKENADTKAMVLNNLGLLYLRLGKPAALSCLKESLAIREKAKDTNRLISSYLNLSEFYRPKNTSLSKMYARKAYEMAVKIHSTEDRLLALKILNSITNGAEFKHYTSIYITLMDSANTVTMKTKSQFAAIRYSAKKAEAESLKLKEKAAKQAQNVIDEKRNKLILILIIAIIAITAASIIYILILRHKKEKSLQVYNTETRMSKKIHDELANDMFKVMSFAESQDFSSPAQQQKLVQNLDLLYNKTRDISRENSDIDTSENFGHFLTDMLAGYKTAETNVVAISFEASDWAKLETYKKIAVYRVLQELMVNMKKHSRATKVAFKFTKDEKKMTIQYTDNGQGFSSEELIYKNGLQNAETRMLSVNGSLTFDSKQGKGLKVIIVIPL